MDLHFVFFEKVLEEYERTATTRSSTGEAECLLKRRSGAVSYLCGSKYLRSGVLLGLCCTCLDQASHFFYSSICSADVLLGESRQTNKFRMRKCIHHVTSSSRSPVAALSRDIRCPRATALRLGNSHMDLAPIRVRGKRKRRGPP